MNLTRLDPFRELEEISDQLNRFLTRQDTWRSDSKELMTVADWVPPVDISETDEEFHIEAELPEVKQEDMKVTLNNGVLTLQGERREEEGNGRKAHRTERSYGQFVRRFTLPDIVDDTKVKAEFREGVLHLHLPKSQEAKPKAIEIEVA
ncbi:MAG TPA: Hsp20/alpha crystallin family protein [Nitrospiraceae bacterium]|nr:Hsp20/alpha crystallin family protein [Nitrospiraceae bacterium]